MDFYEIAEAAEGLAPDLLIGHSKGYHLARRWQAPLIRVGFPIHDRFGGQRILHLGYRGAQNLLDCRQRRAGESRWTRQWATATSNGKQEIFQSLATGLHICFIA